jgi:hypothetical protein
VRQAVTGARRRLADTPFLTARHLWLHTDPPLDLDVHGEIRGRTPAQITLEANALRVMVRPTSPTYAAPRSLRRSKMPPRPDSAIARSRTDACRVWPGGSYGTKQGDDPSR